MPRIHKKIIFILPAVLTACVNLPTGPSVMVLPGSSKSFEQFRYDDYECRRYAYEQIGGVTANQAATSSGLTSAAVGSGLGAAAGAAIGGGEGAAIGAGTGLLAGGLAGSGTARTSSYENQYRYDISYIQCMYAKGHRVPVSGKITSEVPTTVRQKPIKISPSQPGFTPPPPPPGNPPPPPPQ
ncbi:Glycine-zipper containing OmpA-like membrane domain-containing protein [Nitrosomonas marina]|uniref:Glycine-zipper containing OmpA-like membrane domain-containing protein n=1 Tax=Nitrosomonas marina TaxID=917 RepID=A0A1I0F5Q8_9PROT|nr:glycine zipper family protein [Nitrosomonas marina]SET53423.1 Glycine-zipper containing OmpA-like membrane domain-containing protein [Nitrosomonas marina]